MQPLCFMAPLFPYTNLLKMSLIQKMLISDYFHYDIFTNALLTKNREKCLRSLTEQLTINEH